jgi:thiamine biosynthesis protein ThiI
MEFNNVIGGLLLKNIPNISVDVHNPEYTLKIEIRDKNTYIYGMEIKGAGGYPVGVAGKGILMLSGGIDSPVAGYLAMKRGIKIECLYFESPPHTSEMAKNKVKQLVEKLSEFQPDIKLHVVNFTNMQEAIYKNINPDYMITIMRRMMYRISERLIRTRKALVLINGESVGQVASQTLPSMSVINNVTNIPVIRPVACLDKLEIIDIAKKIDTYETSILPYEDCCTIFLPKHPVINPELSLAIEYENSFDYQTLIEEAIATKETITIKKNNNKFDI